MKSLTGATIAAAIMATATAAHGETVKFRFISDGSCGWYIVLGCGKSHAALMRQRDMLGGPNAGGGAGLSVIDTSGYANFRPGFQCLVDGPYPARDQARSVAWAEAVPDAYVKKGC